MRWWMCVCNCILDAKIFFFFSSSGMHLVVWCIPVLSKLPRQQIPARSLLRLHTDEVSTHLHESSVFNAPATRYSSPQKLEKKRTTASSRPAVGVRAFFSGANHFNSTRSD